MPFSQPLLTALPPGIHDTAATPLRPLPAPDTFSTSAASDVSHASAPPAIPFPDSACLPIALSSALDAGHAHGEALSGDYRTAGGANGDGSSTAGDGESSDNGSDIRPALSSSFSTHAPHERVSPPTAASTTTRTVLLAVDTPPLPACLPLSPASDGSLPSSRGPPPLSGCVAWCDKLPAAAGNMPSPSGDSPPLVKARPAPLLTPPRTPNSACNRSPIGDMLSPAIFAVARSPRGPAAFGAAAAFASAVLTHASMSPTLSQCHVRP